MDKQYWDSFGYEWWKWGKVQTDLMENTRTFISKTGLHAVDVKGETVLDVGCGTGRFMEVCVRWGADTVYGIEPSEAWRLAYNRVTDAIVYHDDIDHFSECWSGQFDIVYCIGVLHHTPNPKESFAKIAKLVKPGGSLHVWVYKRMGKWSRISDFYRIFTTCMPWWLLSIICQLAGPWEYVRRIPKVGQYVWLLFPCSMSKSWKERVLDTFDWYSPKYQSQHTIDEVLEWFWDNGFVDLKTHTIPVSVSGRKQ